MKTKEEAIADLLEENRKYEQLMKKYRGSDELLGEADYLFQDGVRVKDIARILRDLTTIATVIRKGEMVLQQGESTSDPYIHSFDFILNRLLRYCKNEQCNIYPEKRRPTEDNKLELAMLHAKVSGTAFFKGADVTERVRDFALRDKKENISGNQLADLLVSPIARQVLGKIPKPVGNEIVYSSFQAKMAADDFAVFP